MNIYFEPGLEYEATMASESVAKVFLTNCNIIEKDRSQFLQYNKLVDGYELHGLNNQGPCLTLTSKDLFNTGSTSRDDDYLYGFAYHSAWISVCRLRSVDDRPVVEIKVAKETYWQRLDHIFIHELGHVFVRNQEHYKDYVIVNPKTGHKTDTGQHCLDTRCVMSQVEDLSILDARIKTRCLDYFCEPCRTSIRV